jgi:large subunit ribosomal protein L15
MKLSTLSPAKGAVKTRKRVGRGQGSGLGGHSARGINGNKSRAGYKSKRNHEGGQMPLQMRLPKRGFKNSNRRYKSFNPGEYATFNLFELEYHADKNNLTHLTPQVMYELGLIQKGELVKVLGDGQVEKPLQITAHRFSQSAKEALQQAGGKAYFLLKTNQIQGIAHAYSLENIDMQAISRNFDYIGEQDLVAVEEEGSLKQKFNLHVHNITEAAKQQIEALGGTVTVLA